MAYASLEDVAARMGVDVGVLNSAQATAILDDISALVLAYTGRDFENELDGVPPAIKALVAQRTIRALNNPDGIRQETIGTYSYTLALDTSTLLGGWTTEERTILDFFGRALVTNRLGMFATGYGGAAASAEE